MKRYFSLSTRLGKLALATAALFGLTAAVSATPVSFTFDSFTHSKTLQGTLNGETISNLYVGNINVTFMDSASNASVVAYCMEIAQDVSIGQSYNYDAVSLTTAGLSGTQARLVGILYDLYYAGDTTQDWNSVNTGAFQIALWELTHDDDGSLWSESGNFYIDPYSSSKHVADVADDYLASVYAQAADSSYSPYSQLVSLVNADYQDLIVLASLVPGYGGGESVAIPFGVNPLPGLALVGLVGWRRLRRRVNA
jgi:hypothetical protein